MPFQISPGIVTSELDLTAVIPAVSTSSGAIAGVFPWGPTNEAVLITSEAELTARFGKPVDGWNTETFFVAADFTAYASSLYVSRAAQGNTAAASSGSPAQLSGIKARYPGTYGNSLRVVGASGNVYANTDYTEVLVELKAATSRRPRNGKAHLVVLDALGQFTGRPGAVLEVFEDVSMTAGSTRADGSNDYYLDVIETRSRYLGVNSSVTTPVFSTTEAINETLAGGTNGASEYAANTNVLQSAYDVFASGDSIDVSLIMTGVSANNQLANYVIAMAEDRKDALAFVSPPKTTAVNNPGAAQAIVAFAETLTPSSYAVIDSGYKKRYDRYNDKYVFTPLNGDMAGLCARTDQTRDPWFSPAGYQRGQIKNVVKLAFNPNKAERDLLYAASVNPVITQAGQGTVLFGDKTALNYASAFDRINVRRLFIVLEKAIARAAQSTLFEFNDEFTRAQFRNMVEPFLRDVQGRRGIYDFRVVCDETNNTPQVIDSNSFVGDIYVKPARAINFIQLNFVAVRSGVEFEEIVGQRQS